MWHLTTRQDKTHSWLVLWSDCSASEFRLADENAPTVPANKYGMSMWCHCDTLKHIVSTLFYGLRYTRDLCCHTHTSYSACLSHTVTLWNTDIWCHTHAFQCCHTHTSYSACPSHTVTPQSHNQTLKYSRIQCCPRCLCFLRRPRPQQSRSQGLRFSWVTFLWGTASWVTWVSWVTFMSDILVRHCVMNDMSVMSDIHEWHSCEALRVSDIHEWHSCEALRHEWHECHELHSWVTLLWGTAREWQLWVTFLWGTASWVTWVSWVTFMSDIFVRHCAWVTFMSNILEWHYCEALRHEGHECHE